MPLHPERKYRAIVARKADGTADYEFGYSPDKGTPQLLTYFELLEDEWRGDVLPWLAFFTPNTSERTLQQMRNTGWRGESIDDMTGFGDFEVELVVVHETYQEKTRARVAWVNRPGGFRIEMEKKMDGEARKAFAEQLRAQAAAIPAVKAPPTRSEQADQAPANGAGPVAPPASSSRPPASNRNDDVPF